MATIQMFSAVGAKTFHCIVLAALGSRNLSATTNRALLLVRNGTINDMARPSFLNHSIYEPTEREQKPLNG